MGRTSRRHRENWAAVDRQKRYVLGEAVRCLQGLKHVKFDESLDIAIRLGVDARKSEQMVRGVAKLPHGTGRQMRILVFAKGDKEQEARDAGADIVGGEDLVAKIREGWMEFDRAIATPDMMAKVGPIAKILGPRGLLPNPRVGTVTADVGRAVREEKAGRVEFRIDKAGIVHVPVGKLRFGADDLVANVQALLEQVSKARPVTAKGNFIQAMSLSSTMGPGLRLDLAGAQAPTDRG